jgi:hypothetical protein
MSHQHPVKVYFSPWIFLFPICSALQLKDTKYMVKVCCVLSMCIISVTAKFYIDIRIIITIGMDPTMGIFYVLTQFRYWVLKFCEWSLFCVHLCTGVWTQGLTLAS